MSISAITTRYSQNFFNRVYDENKSVSREDRLALSEIQQAQADAQLLFESQRNYLTSQNGGIDPTETVWNDPTGGTGHPANLYSIELVDLTQITNQNFLEQGLAHSAKVYEDAMASLEQTQESESQET